MNHLSKLRDTAKLILAALILSAAFTVASAWTNRPGNPPADNTPPPINVGTVAQSKDGNIGARTILADSVSVGDTINTGAVSAPKFCIGSACITSWPAVDDSGLPALSCVDIVVPPGSSGTAACAALDAACTSLWTWSSFEWWPRACKNTTGNGQATCCRLGGITYTPPPPPPPPLPCDQSDPTGDCYIPPESPEGSSNDGD